jgi:hypothetical protein
VRVIGAIKASPHGWHHGRPAAGFTALRHGKSLGKPESKSSIEVSVLAAYDRVAEAQVRQSPPVGGWVEWQADRAMCSKSPGHSAMRRLAEKDGERHRGEVLAGTKDRF